MKTKKTKKTTRKKTVLADGLHVIKTDKGINVLLAENGHKIALLRGYNSMQSVTKGLNATMRGLFRVSYIDDKTRATKFRFAKVTDKRTKKGKA